MVVNMSFVMIKWHTKETAKTLYIIADNVLCKISF